MSSTFHSGINSKFYVGTATASTELPTVSFSVTPQQDIQTFRNSKTGKFTLAEGTFLSCSVSVTVDYDFANNPFLPANGGVSLTGGGTVAGRAYLNGTSGAYFDFPQMWPTGTPLSDAVEGKPQLTYSLIANGTFAEPAT